MPIRNSHLLLRYCENYRLVTLAGRLGSGKTALAFKLAQELLATGRFRYILSNTSSVWTDDPALVTLRPDHKGVPTYVDAIMILDEAGMFMRSAAEAEEWFVYLRKLNMVLILPSAKLPSRSVQFVTVRRTFDAFVLGLPFWTYKMKMNEDDIEEEQAFTWWHPQEIFGIYDTLALPQDADVLQSWFYDWIDIAREERAKFHGADYGKQRTFASEHKQQLSDMAGVAQARNIESAIAGIEQAERKISKTISASNKRARGRA